MGTTGTRRAALTVGVDTGGTFTDLCWVERGELRIHKLAGTPDDPSRSVLEGLARAPAGGTVVHGTTVATNALLEGRLARTALVTNRGFEDLVAIGRQNRPGLYALEPPLPPVPVPAELRFGIAGRLDPEGAELEALDREELRALGERLGDSGAEAVAVCLLHSYADGVHEREVARVLGREDRALCLSHEVLPEHREYERFVTTVLNAGLAPRVARYLGNLARGLGERRLSVMNSAGGTLGSAAAAAFPVQTLLSGPAGGVLGARSSALRAGLEQIVTLDMGGTSTDVALCPGRVSRTGEGRLGELPLRLARVDLHTVGAGGGSLARRDPGGALQVGPESAGADPGPACYGRGGEGATVTDAHLVLGRLGPEGLLGRSMPLDREAAREAVARLARDLGLGLEETAEGILRVASATMERALRTISVERGYDPRGFALVAFGGAGPLHGAELAEALGLPRLLVPRHPGALSALGMILAGPRRDLSLTLLSELGDLPSRRIEDGFRELEERGREEIEADGADPAALRCERSADLRYRGQSFELTVPWRADPAEAFHEAHRRRFGLARREAPVELVALRVAVSAPGARPHFPVEPEGPPDSRDAKAGEEEVRLDGRAASLSVYDRERLRPGHRIAGPARISEFSSTTLVPTGWVARVDGQGQLRLALRGAEW